MYISSRFKHACFYSSSYCSEDLNCVTTSSNWKIMFGKGVELTVESSEYQTKIDSCQQVTNARRKELLEKNKNISSYLVSILIIN